MGGLVYGGSGKLLDVYRPALVSEPLPAVLLWHGRGPDERDVLAPLARAVAEFGVVVFVPDWCSDARDGGRTHLRESAAFVRRNVVDLGGDPARIALAGWSLGGKSAVSAALNPSVLDGWAPRAVVGIAGGCWTPAPTTGTAPMDDLRGAVPTAPVVLVHGTADTVVDIQQSRELRDALVERGCVVSLEEVDSDHAGVVMTEYAPELGRCRPTVAEHAVRAGRRTAQLVALAAGADD
ncbi:alpha/beta hydrolase [Streptomyces sp. NBC_01465]|uniref:alpha/beta hydrolase n=1 Tax=Streptomyces sp. NBC_01465 TaxID=2903878 RepID=UPI002E35C5CF|nr:alpha/beta hydrolase [Streptomyces sp. NBC_01465]